MLNAAPFSDVVELCKEVAGKHCLHEPNWSPPCQFAHAQAWGETHDPVLLAQSDGGEMFALGLSTQTKPERSVVWKNLRLGLRHSRAGFPSSLPRSAIFSTPALLFAGNPSRAGFSRGSGPLFQLINFNQTNSGSAIPARQDGGIIARRHGSHNSGLEIIRRRHASRLNLRLLGVFPIIVVPEDSTVYISQAKERIGQHSSDVKGWLSQSRTKPTD